MKSKWEYKKLGEVCDYPNRRIAIKDLSIGEYIGVEHLIKNKGGLRRSTQMPDAENAIEFCIGDVLIGNIRPYLRKIWLAHFNGGASGDVIVVRTKREFSNKIFPSYLYKVLSSENFFEYDNNNTKGAKMPRGDRNAIAEYLIPVPPLDEQQRIVAELDLLTSVIDKQKAQLKELDTLAQSIFYDMFGDKTIQKTKWQKCHVGDVYKFQYGKGNKIPENKGIYPCYGSNGIVGFHTEYNSEDAPIIGHIGAYAGIVNWAQGKHFVTYNGVMCWLKNRDRFNSIYGYYMLKSQDYMSQARGGAAQPFVSYDMLETPEILVPPLPLQQEFADKIQSIEKQKAAINQSIADTQTLLDYTMDKYFG